MAEPQGYANHAQYRRVYHYVVLPIFIVNAGVFLWRAVRQPDLAHWWAALLAVAVVAYMWDARSAMLTIQDRLIRLEMRLRLERLLGPEGARQAAALRVGQLVALRFASDAELPGLVRRVLAGELVRGRDIKRAIGDWQRDTLRA
ncbi:MAG TPA: DUF6526 family protein [Gemmatimonadaceae bacterium]|nr:DUF6526 family protein [Gemmatimonadaceae bacterium]